MEKEIKVLHIGIKEWPYSAGVKEGKNRGGGVGKYVEILFGSFPENIKLYVITRKLKGQKKSEQENNIEIRRVNTLSGRKLRTVSLGFLSFFKALKIIKKENIDIIHSHIFFNNIIAILLKAVTKKPVIVVPHSQMYHRFLLKSPSLRKKTERYFEQKIYKYADKVVLFTQQHVDTYIEITKEKKINFAVVHTGMKIKALEAPVFDFKKKIKILYVGRLQKGKAVDSSIKAISLLNDEQKAQIEFNVVGEGDEKDNLTRQAKKLGLSSIVKFRGYQSNPSAYYENTDIFLLPTDTEGLSMALLEAMMCWSACIVNNWGVPFAKDTVYELKNNLPETIKTALALFISNKELIKKYAIRGRKEIERDFSGISFANKYINLYKELL